MGGILSKMEIWSMDGEDLVQILPPSIVNQIIKSYQMRSCTRDKLKKENSKAALHMMSALKHDMKTIVGSKPMNLSF